MSLPLFRYEFGELEVYSPLRSGFTEWERNGVIVTGMQVPYREQLVYDIERLK